MIKEQYIIYFHQRKDEYIQKTSVNRTISHEKLRRVDIATIIEKSFSHDINARFSYKMLIFDMPESPIFTMSVIQ